MMSRPRVRLRVIWLPARRPPDAAGPRPPRPPGPAPARNSAASAATDSRPLPRPLLPPPTLKALGSSGPAVPAGSRPAASGALARVPVGGGGWLGKGSESIPCYRPTHWVWVSWLARRRLMAPSQAQTRKFSGPGPGRVGQVSVMETDPTSENEQDCPILEMK